MKRVKRNRRNRGRSFNEVICKKNAIRVSAKNEDGLVNHWHLISKVDAHVHSVPNEARVYIIDFATDVTGLSTVHSTNENYHLFNIKRYCRRIIKSFGFSSFFPTHF